MKSDNAGIVFILPTVLNQTSNGHKSVAWLIRYFCNKKIKCTLLVPSTDRFLQLSSICLPENLDICDYSNPPESSICVIANDTSSILIAEQLRFKNHKILWWLLAPPNLLGTPFPDIHISDGIAVYSSFVLPYLNEYCFIQDPQPFVSLRDNLSALAPSMHGATSKNNTKNIAIYCGKGRLVLLPRRLEQLVSEYDITYFTRYKPKSRQLYEKLLFSCDALISYDPLTAVILDFAALGKPVYLPHDPFPKSSYAAYPLSCLDNVYHDYEMWLHHLKLVSSDPYISIQQAISEINVANKIGAANLDSLILCLTQEAQNHLSFELIPRLKEYTNSLLIDSTIQPSLDGQAPSSRYLPIYNFYLKLPERSRLPLRRPLQYVMKLSDLLYTSRNGRVILRLTLHLPWTIRSACIRLAFYFKKALLNLDLTISQ